MHVVEERCRLDTAALRELSRRLSANRRRELRYDAGSGEVAEWLKVPHSKCGEGETPP